MPVKILRELRMKVRKPIAVQEEGKPAVGNLPQGENLAVDLEGRLIDPDPSDNGNTKTQDEWIAYFNGRNEMMVSMPDIYLVVKSGNQALFDSLRKDIKEIWIVTSTRIFYNNLDAWIVHNYGSKLIRPVEHRVVIPEYLRHPLELEYVLNTQEGLGSLQALFGTNDDAQGIKDALHRLSDYAIDKIKIGFRALSARPIERTAGFDYEDGEFHVGGYDLYYGTGRSRGVRCASDSER